MLRLNNIIRKGNFVSATVTTVEEEPRVFDITVDIFKQELVENSLGEMNMFVSMARNKLVKLAIEYGNKLPKEAVSVWY